MTFSLSGFSTPPNIASEGRSPNGADGYFARGSGIWSTTSYGVYAWEDIITDAERAHTSESFSMLAVEDAAQINLFESIASFETPNYDISNILSYNTSEINFTTVQEAGVTFTLEYAISSDGGASFGSYVSINSGDELTGLSAITDFTNHRIKFRGTITNANNLSNFSLSELSISIENI